MPCWDARRTPRAATLLAALEARRGKSVFVRYLRTLGDRVDCGRGACRGRADTGLGSAEAQADLPADGAQSAMALALFGTLLGASVPAGVTRPTASAAFPTRRFWRPDRDRGRLPGADRPADPKPEDLFAFQMLVGLLLSNGPGTISAQGAKGASPPTARRRRSGCSSTRPWSAF